MKRRDLLTTYDLIASSYSISKDGDYFIHKFSPKNTSTIYQARTTSSTPIITEGDRYNIGYSVDNGVNWVEVTAISNSSKTTPDSAFSAMELAGKELYDTEKAKNDARIKYNAKGYYWGKKYAWRVFGIGLAKEAFYKYLKEIKHPFIECTVFNVDKGHPPSKSIAYSEKGLKDAVENLIKSAKPVGARYKSPHYTHTFTIKGFNAITDKK
ncbi:hypothetical protein [Pseudodesulfovibrio pelocollis]|uniref:hypothetical protein n=1 Tax=Pseudodesulfovibrio pelocollis TaxID=3051432 RepID=UPI00255B1053|nr:hypothetical protein [Pseudodesulfovibrio sp. SB368]